MDEAALLIERPDRCYRCHLAIRDEFRDIVCVGANKILTDNFGEYRRMQKPKWCPLITDEKVIKICNDYLEGEDV